MPWPSRQSLTPRREGRDLIPSTKRDSPKKVISVGRVNLLGIGARGRIGAIRTTTADLMPWVRAKPELRVVRARKG